MMKETKMKKETKKFHIQETPTLLTEANRKTVYKFEEVA